MKLDFSNVSVKTDKMSCGGDGVIKIKDLQRYLSFQTSFPLADTLQDILIINERSVREAIRVEAQGIR